MQLTLRRIVDDGDTTIGFLEADADPVIRLATCEDEYRVEKLVSETRIPAGTYEITLRIDSPMADRYRDRFGPWHRGMLWLQDVPGFDWIYLHCGNTDDDTDGCILAGDKANFAGMLIEGSVAGYVRLARAVMGALDTGERVTITIFDPGTL